MTFEPTVVEPLSRCGACGKTDDHPKHQIAIGFNNENTNGMFHEHDEDRDGVIQYHFDCPTPWHSKVDAPTAAHIAKVAALAASGVHGDELRRHIVEGTV
jgi:hypothetical protein